MNTDVTAIVAKDSTNCGSMEEVREGVDAIDRQIVELLARRFGYMDAAARIKPDRGSVRDQARKDDVQAKVGAEAARLGLPADRIAAIWEEIMEQSIAYEFEQYDAMRS